MSKSWLGDKLTDIVIVILGITIAFQLNAWNERVKEKEKEQAFLLEILKDLESDAEELRDLIGRQEKN